MKFYSADGQYADALTLEQANLPDVMIVLLMDGRPIPPGSGRTGAIDRAEDVCV